MKGEGGIDTEGGRTARNASRPPLRRGSCPQPPFPLTGRGGPGREGGRGGAAPPPQCRGHGGLREGAGAAGRTGSAAGAAGGGRRGLRGVGRRVGSRQILGNRRLPSRPTRSSRAGRRYRCCRDHGGHLGVSGAGQGLREGGRGRSGSRLSGRGRSGDNAVTAGKGQGQVPTACFTTSYPAFFGVICVKSCKFSQNARVVRGRCGEGPVGRAVTPCVFQGERDGHRP